VFSILAGLPSQYKTIVDILVTSGTNEDLTFTNTFSKLMAKEVETNAEEETGAFVAKTQRRVDDREWYYCGKKGHIKQYCKKRMAEQGGAMTAVAL
jgi:hypothetical protein